MEKTPIDPAFALALEYRRPLHFEGAKDMLNFWDRIRHTMFRQAREYNPEIHDGRLVFESVDDMPTKRFLQALYADGRLGTADAILNMALGMPLIQVHFVRVATSSNLAPEFNICLRWGK